VVPSPEARAARSRASAFAQKLRSCGRWRALADRVVASVVGQEDDYFVEPIPKSAAIRARLRAANARVEREPFRGPIKARRAILVGLGEHHCAVPQSVA
jgi:hypothetical protein